MRRPLLFGAFCLVALIALGHFGRPADIRTGPPDGTHIWVTGQICDKDSTSFEIQIQEILIQENQIKENQNRETQKRETQNRENQNWENQNWENQNWETQKRETQNQETQNRENQNWETQIQDSQNQENSYHKTTYQESSYHKTTYQESLYHKTTYQETSNYFNKGKLIISYDNAEQFIIGAKVTLSGTFYGFTSATNPGEFDFAGYYHSMGYIGRIYDAEVQSMSGRGGIREKLYRLRTFWENRLYAVFPKTEASVMAAILLGEKSDVDAGIKALYQRNGIIHILSISGLHISIIGMGLYKLLRKVGMPIGAAALIGAAVLVLYGIMTGFGVSVCRAVGMYLLRMLAALWGRTYDMLTALGFMGALMALFHPAWLGHMGYLLSFGAVLGLGLLSPALTNENKADEPSKMQKFDEGFVRRTTGKLFQLAGKVLGGGLMTGLSVSLTTLPIQLWFQYEISLYSIFLNVLILPLMSVVMIVGLVVMLLPGSGMLGTIDVVILKGYESLCYVFEHLPSATWNPGKPEGWQVAVFYLLWAAVVWGLPWLEVRWKCKGAERRKGVQGVLLAAAVGVLALPEFGGDRVTFLDVGQGDCACVQLSSGEVYLFDCGSSSRRGIGEEVLIPFLKYYGISEVDAIFASHGDADHINGLEQLLMHAEENHIKVGQLVLPRMQEQGVPSHVREQEQGMSSHVKEQEQGMSSHVKEQEQGMPSHVKEQEQGVPSHVKEQEQGVSSHVKEQESGGLPHMEEDRLREEFAGLLAAAEMADVPVRTIAAGENWTCGATGNPEHFFVCLHPAIGTSVGGNAGSECFCVELREGSRSLTLLFTGDVEGEGEAQLTAHLAQYGIAGVDVLKVSHHGSRNSSSQEFLGQVRPRVAIISCGRNNSYGHPHRETLERLEGAGSRVFGTPEYGAITVEIDENIRIRGFKGDNK